MTLLTLLLVSWPVAVIVIVEVALAILLIKGIKYLKKKKAEKNND